MHTRDRKISHVMPSFVKFISSHRHADLTVRSLSQQAVTFNFSKTNWLIKMLTYSDEPFLSSGFVLKEKV